MSTPATVDGLPTLTIGPSGGTNALGSYIGSVDPVNDLIPIYDASTTSTVNIYRNQLLNLSSGPVGLTDSQTLTNKTLTSPTLTTPIFNGTILGTYTLAGTPTFPSSVVTTTGSQSLTNKTIIGGTASAMTIINPVLTVDNVAGYTTSNAGTVYGIGITGGNTITTALTLSNGLTLSSGTLTLPNNSITAPMLATSAITLGYAQVVTGTSFTTTSNSYVAVTGLTVNVTIPAGGRTVKVTAYTYYLGNSSGTNGAEMAIYSGATTGALTTQLVTGEVTTGASGQTGTPVTIMSITTPSAGSIWYTVAALATGGTTTVGNTSTSPAFVLVEMI